jgi:hypothetical protein
MITPEQFRAGLSHRLNQILPDGFKTSPTEDGIWLDAPDGLGALGWAGHIDKDPSNFALYREAGVNVLSSLQDCVSMTLREFWPLAATEPEHRMAMPGGRIEGAVLYLWYGQEISPIVSLDSIDLGG